MTDNDLNQDLRHFCEDLIVFRPLTHLEVLFAFKVGMALN